VIFLSQTPVNPTGFFDGPAQSDAAGFHGSYEDIRELMHLILSGWGYVMHRHQIEAWKIV